MAETYTPSDEEVQKALTRIRKQREQRKAYTQKRMADPNFKEKQKEYRKKYHGGDPAKAKARRQAYYAKNKEALKAYHKKYQDRNKALLTEVKKRAKELNMTVDQYLAASGA